MENYFIDTVNVIIDGGQSQELVTIAGLGNYNPSTVKYKAMEIIEKRYPNSILAAVIILHRKATIEEYKTIIESNPSWLGNVEE